MTNLSRKCLPLAIALGAALSMPFAMAQVQKPSTNPAAQSVTPPPAAATTIAPAPTTPEVPTAATSPTPNTPPDTTGTSSTNSTNSTTATNQTTTNQTSSTGVTGETATTTKPSTSVTEKSRAKTGGKSWQELDANGDGNLSKSEAAGNPDMLRVFAKADANHDGILTPDEYRTYYSANVSASHH